MASGLGGSRAVVPAPPRKAAEPTSSETSVVVHPPTTQNTAPRSLTYLHGQLKELQRELSDVKSSVSPEQRSGPDVTVYGTATRDLVDDDDESETYGSTIASAGDVCLFLHPTVRRETSILMRMQIVHPVTGKVSASWTTVAEEGSDSVLRYVEDFRNIP